LDLEFFGFGVTLPISLNMCLNRKEEQNTKTNKKWKYEKQVVFAKK
jgi:hypothetical protein